MKNLKISIQTEFLAFVSVRALLVSDGKITFQ